MRTMKNTVAERGALLDHAKTDAIPADAAVRDAAMR